LRRILNEDIYNSLIGSQGCVSEKKGNGYTDFHVAVVVLFDISLAKDRAKTKKALMKGLGYRFALARLAIDLVGIAIIALALKAVVTQKEVDRLYEKAQEMDVSLKGKK
jgi:hypothetical protein